MCKNFRDYYTRINRDKINIVLITGAANGLGRLLAIHLHKDGYKVIAIDKVPENTLDSQIKDALSDYITFDLSKIYEIEDVVKKIILKYGNIDLLINNVAIMNFNLLNNDTIDIINNKITVNLTSVIVITKCVVESMNEQKFGRIINISSSSAFQAEDKFPIYSPTKCGVMMFSDSLAKWFQNKLKGNITSNSINPHRISTPQYLAENPTIDPNTLISSERIYKRIIRVATSNLNGSTIPVFGIFLKIKYLLNYVIKLFWY